MSALVLKSPYALPRKCRACLEFLDGEQCVDLETPLSESVDEDEIVVLSNSAPEALSLLEVFNVCTQLQVRLDGNDAEKQVWRYLCRSCYSELRDAYQFIVKARQSHSTLNGQMIDENLKWNIVQPIVDYELGFVETLDEEFQQEEKSPQSSSASYQRVELELAGMFGMDFDEEQTESVTKVEDTNTDNLEVLKCEPDLKQSLDPVPQPCEETLCEHERGSIRDDDDEDATSIVVRLVTSDDDEEHELESRLLTLEYKCELCTDKFDFQSDLVQHYELNHDEKDLNFSCGNCHQRFYAKSTLNNHIRQIHKNCEYQDCLTCGRTVLKSFFKIHQQRHYQMKRYLCSECPRTFSSNYVLKKHLQIHSKDRDRNIECDQCSRRFFTMEAFRTHQLTHLDPDQRVTYNCSLCTKTFMRQTNLKLHMQMHRGETMNCPHCGKQFVRRKDLEIHIRFHTGEFPYACKTCQQRFAIKGHLTAHEKKHRGIKYQCSQCEKQFLNIAGLRQHSFEHTGMPLYCGVCQKGFPTRFKVRRHIRSVHHNIFSVDAGSSDADVEQHIMQREKNSAGIAVVEVAPLEQQDNHEVYEIKMLEEEAENMTNF